MAIEGSMDVAAVRSPEAREALNRGLGALQDGLRLPGLESALEDGGLPRALRSALERWWAAYDAYLEIVSLSLDVRCGIGCAHCCHDNPRGLSGVELLWLDRALRGHPEEGRLRERIARASAVHQARLDAHGDPARAQREAKAARQPCALLGADQRCSVYAHRPIACRMFFSITEPEWCHVEHARSDEAVNPHLEPAKVLRQIIHAISHRLGLQDLPDDLARGLHALRVPFGADSKQPD